MISTCRHGLRGRGKGVGTLWAEIDASTVYTPLMENAARFGRSLKSVFSQQCRKELPSEKK
jgi:hypothetical protein